MGSLLATAYDVLPYVFLELSRQWMTKRLNLGRVNLFWNRLKIMEIGFVIRTESHAVPVGVSGKANLEAIGSYRLTQAPGWIGIGSDTTS